MRFNERDTCVVVNVRSSLKVQLLIGVDVTLLVLMLVLVLVLVVLGRNKNRRQVVRCGVVKRKSHEKTARGRLPAVGREIGIGQWVVQLVGHRRNKLECRLRPANGRFFIYTAFAKAEDPTSSQSYPPRISEKSLVNRFHNKHVLGELT